jgi:hypothetical protein
MPYHRGSPDTPSPRGWTSPDRDPCANPDLRSSAVCWHPPGSSSHRRQSLRRQPDRPQCTSRRPARTCGEIRLLAKTLVASPRKSRMIRDSVLDPELADPAIAKFTCTSRQISRSERIANTCPTTSIRVAKMKLVEQLTLVTLQTAHHGSTLPRIASTQRNHASRPVSTDFCNNIGTFRTWRPWCLMSAVEVTAEEARTLADFRK